MDPATDRASRAESALESQWLLRAGLASLAVWLVMAGVGWRIADLLIPAPIDAGPVRLARSGGVRTGVEAGSAPADVRPFPPVQRQSTPAVRGIESGQIAPSRVKTSAVETSRSRAVSLSKRYRKYVRDRYHRHGKAWERDDKERKGKRGKRGGRGRERDDD